MLIPYHLRQSVETRERLALPPGYPSHWKGHRSVHFNLSCFLFIIRVYMDVKRDIGVSGRICDNA